MLRTDEAIKKGEGYEEYIDVDSFIDTMLFYMAIGAYDNYVKNMLYVTYDGGDTWRDANMMETPVIGFVENYSYLECPDCGKKIEGNGKSTAETIAKYTMSQYGRMLCNECGKKEHEARQQANEDKGVL